MFVKVARLLKIFQVKDRKQSYPTIVNVDGAFRVECEYLIIYFAGWYFCDGLMRAMCWSIWAVDFSEREKV